MAVYYIAPDLDCPIGGIKQMYHHVSTLRKRGVDAWVIHGKPKFKCSWFHSDAPTGYVPSSLVYRAYQKGSRRSNIDWIVERLNASRMVFRDEGGRFVKRALSPDDVVVYPEIAGLSSVATGSGTKKVIFNQHTYISLCNRDEDRAAFNALMKDPDFLGFVTVSQDNYEYLQYACPSAPIYRVVNGIDLDLFRYRESKDKVISYMPRRGYRDLQQILTILSLRGRYDHWTIKSIDNVSEETVAEILGESAVFISAPYQEGWSLPPVEAGASGAVVVGYSGMGGSEYFIDKHCYPVPTGDVKAFCTTLEQVLAKIDAGDDTVTEKKEAFRAAIQDSYSMAQQEDSVVEMWQKMGVIR